MKKEGNVIIASEGCVLFYVPENKIWGEAARLADYKGKPLLEKDFKDLPISETVVIDGKYYTFFGWSYADIKTFVVKLHYSNDDQIALMLNYQNDPETYAEKYNAMTIWRNYASEVARKYSDGNLP